MNPPCVLVVVGMADERAIAAGVGREVVVGAANARLLRQRLDAVNTANIRSVYSFGVAGGLDPELKPGDLLVATQVVRQSLEGERSLVADSWFADPDLLAAIQSRAAGAGNPVVRPGVFLGTDVEARDNAFAALEKLRAERGAAIVDNESHIAAAFAAEHGLPFISVRAVSDSVHRHLPPAALLALHADGSPNSGAIAKSLLRSPWQLPALVRTARDYNRALRALRRFVREIGFVHQSA